MFTAVAMAAHVASAPSFKSPGADMAIFSRAFVRRRAIGLAINLSVSATSFALAQGPGDGHHLHQALKDRNERQFLFARDLAVSDMSRASLAQPTGSVDRDFVAMMVPNNQATIDMARAELAYGHNDDLRRLAQDIIAHRQHDISAINKAARNMPSMQAQASTSAPSPVSLSQR